MNDKIFAKKVKEILGETEPEKCLERIDRLLIPKRPLLLALTIDPDTGGIFPLSNVQISPEDLAAADSQLSLLANATEMLSKQYTEARIDILKSKPPQQMLSAKEEHPES